MNIGPYITEDLETMGQAIEKAFKKYFKRSFISAKPYYGLGDTEDVFVHFTLGKDKSEYSNGIIQNDPMWTQIWIRPSNGKWKANRSTGGGVSIVSKNPMYAFEGVKVWKRDFTVKDEAQVVKKFDVYFKLLAKAVKDNIDNMGELPFDPRKKV